MELTPPSSPKPNKGSTNNSTTTNRNIITSTTMKSAGNPPGSTPVAGGGGGGKIEYTNNPLNTTTKTNNNPTTTDTLRQRKKSNTPSLNSKITSKSNNNGNNKRRIPSSLSHRENFHANVVAKEIGNPNHNNHSSSSSSLNSTTASTARNSSSTTSGRVEHIHSNVLAIISLSDWLDSYGIKTDSLFGRYRETFTDSNGILRYVDNWQAIEEDELNSRIIQDDNLFYNYTGCVKVNIKHCIEEEEQIDDDDDEEEEEEEVENVEEKGKGVKAPLLSNNTNNNKKKNKKANRAAISTKISFLNDYKILWKFFALDNEDEIAEQAPLLRLFIEFFFHYRTCQLMLFLYIYNLIVYTICFILFPTGLDKPLYVYDYLTSTVQILTYFGIVSLYRGKISFTENFLMKTTHDQHLSSMRKMKNLKQKKKSIHNKNGNGIIGGVDSTTTTAGRAGGGGDVNQSKYITYYSVHWSATLRQLWNNSMDEFQKLFWRPKTLEEIQKEEFLNEISDDTNGGDQKISYYEVLNISLKFLTRHNGIKPKEINFDRKTYRMMLLFTVTIFPLYLFLDNFVFPYYAYVTAYCVGNFHSEFCHYYIFYLILSIGTLTKFVMQYIFAASVLVSLVGLAYGCEIIFRLINSWMEKFSCLRRVNYHHSSIIITDSKFLDKVNEESDGNDVVTRNSTVAGGFIQGRFDDDEGKDGISILYEKRKNNETVRVPEADYGVALHSINDLLRRDSTEHYFFIKEVVNAADKIWSNTLTSLFALAIYIIVAYMTYLIFFLKAVAWVDFVYVQLALLMGTRICFLVIYPITSICHANNFLYEIQNCFLNSSPEDFTVIGGRERWLKLIEVNPIVWTYYGIWITWGKLLGLIWTSIFTVVAIFVSTLTSEAFSYF